MGRNYRLCFEAKIDSWCCYFQPTQLAGKNKMMAQNLKNYPYHCVQENCAEQSNVLPKKI